MQTEVYDVCVAGGGSAGLAAAVAAARLGARTLLVERHGALGGMASAALVHSICGLYRLPAKESAPVLANGGLASECAARLLASGAATGPLRMGRVDVLLQRPAAFARLADDMVQAEAPCLDVRLHSEITAAEADTVTLACRGTSRRVQARAWVDATGDGVLAALRGAPWAMEPAERLQRPAFIFALGGVSPATLDDDGRLRLGRRIVHAIRAGNLPAGLLGAHFRASPQAGEAFVTIDLAVEDGFDPLDGDCLSRLEMDGRRWGESLAAFLRAEAEGFAGSYVAAWPARAGVRESRRVCGRYQIEADDIIAGAEFPDTVAYSAWPMEFRETASGPRLRFPLEERSCGVPLRALRARDDARLFLAGRCLSCSHEAQGGLARHRHLPGHGRSGRPGRRPRRQRRRLHRRGRAAGAGRNRPMNVAEKIFSQADRGAIALVCGDEKITYGKLLELADAAAARLGAVDAERVALDCPNGVAHVVLALGIVRSGKCLVPLAGELAPPERARIIRETGVGAIVDATGAVHLVPRPAGLDFDEKALAALEPAFIRFSSGYDGHEQGSGDFSSHAARPGDGGEPRAADRSGGSHYLGATHGAPFCRLDHALPSARRDDGHRKLAAGRGRPCRRPPTWRLGSVRRAFSPCLAGGGKFRPALAHPAPGRLDRRPPAVADGPGPSTLATACRSARGSASSSWGCRCSTSSPPAQSRARSAGRCLTSKREVRAEGELFLRGPGIFDAYLRPWRRRAEVLDGAGWFRTGDLARRDADGDIFLLGRSHSVINVGGLKCFPEEIEAVLGEAPGVAAVRVRGRENARFGAVPVAEIEARNPAKPPSAGELALFCRQALAGYKGAGGF